MSDKTEIKLDVIDLLLKVDKPIECIMGYLRKKGSYAIDVELLLAVWQWLFQGVDCFKEEVMSNKLDAEVIKIIYKDLQSVMEDRLL